MNAVRSGHSRTQVPTESAKAGRTSVQCPLLVANDVPGRTAALASRFVDFDASRQPRPRRTGAEYRRRQVQAANSTHAAWRRGGAAVSSMPVAPAGVAGGTELSSSERINAPSTPLRFGPDGRFELRPAEYRLLVDGQAAALGGRALDLLLALAARRAELLTTEIY